MLKDGKITAAAEEERFAESHWADFLRGDSVPSGIDATLAEGLWQSIVILKQN